MRDVGVSEATLEEVAEQAKVEEKREDSISLPQTSAPGFSIKVEVDDGIGE